MDIVIAAVGRAKVGPERDLFQHYARRIRWPLLLREVEEKRPLPTSERVSREGDMLLAAVPSGAVVVALDSGGKIWSSEDFAARVGAWRDGGVPALAFLVGGADGHGTTVKSRADVTLSLGSMTWPHMLVRAMLAEQLYRGQSILEGHPYHRG